MSYINPIAENWRRFQAELFPEIESDIGTPFPVRSATPGPHRSEGVAMSIPSFFF